MDAGELRIKQKCLIVRFSQHASIDIISFETAAITTTFLLLQVTHKKKKDGPTSPGGTGPSSPVKSDEGGELEESILREVRSRFLPSFVRPHCAFISRLLGQEFGEHGELEQVAVLGTKASLVFASEEVRPIVHASFGPFVCPLPRDCPLTPLFLC